MATWTTAREIIRAQVEAVSGVPTYWRILRGQVLNKRFIRLTRANSIRNHQDAHTVGEYDQNQIGEELPIVSKGNRIVTISAVCTSFDMRDGFTAWEILETLRAGIRRPTTRAALQAVEFAINDVGDIQDVPTVMDQHEVSRAALEIILNHKQEITIERVTWIEQVQFKARVSGKDQETILTPPNSGDLDPNEFSEDFET